MKNLCVWWQEHQLRPPHIILWRLIWAVPIYLLLTLLSACVLLGLGKDEALRVWRELS